MLHKRAGRAHRSRVALTRCGFYFSCEDHRGRCGAIGIDIARG
jgi:hypothetical protein